MYVPRAMYSLRMSFWVVPLIWARGYALLLGRGDVQRQQDRGRGVDRHGCTDSAEGQAVEENLHVRQRADRDADSPDLALGLRSVGVVAHLCRQVERDRKARLALLEQVPKAPVGVFGGREPGVLAHRPEPAAIHRGLDASSERKLARPAEIRVFVQRANVRRRVQILNLETGRGEEATLALGRPGNGSRTCRGSPLLASRVRAGLSFGVVVSDRPILRHVVPLDLPWSLFEAFVAARMMARSGRRTPVQAPRSVGDYPGESRTWLRARQRRSAGTTRGDPLEALP